MGSIMRGSAVRTNGRPAQDLPGEQLPSIVVYGNPPALIRLESEDLIPLAQALINRTGPCWLVTPNACSLLQPDGGAPPAMPQPFPTVPAAAMPTEPAPAVPPGFCTRCSGSGRTARGTQCPVCGGSGKVKVR